MTISELLAELDSLLSQPTVNREAVRDTYHRIRAARRQALEGGAGERYLKMITEAT